MEIKEFFSTYRDEICEAYSERVKNAKSKKDFADMLDINVCDWLCKMNRKHHDVGSFIGGNFGNFINGRFFNIVETERGDYSCGLCVGQYLQTETLLSNDITCFIDSDIQKLTLAKNNIRTIICSNSKIVVTEIAEDSKLFVEKDDTTVIEFDKKFENRIIIRKIKE